MNIFTSGYELTTAITNALIFIVSLFCVIKIKNNKLWKLFFILMCIDSFLGVIVHGIVMSNKVNDILWVILTLFFTLTVNTLLCIYLKLSYKHIAILSILLAIVLFIQMMMNFNYLLTFDFYALFILLICTYFIIKDWNKGSIWIIIGFILQVIGGILMICKVKAKIINHNGIYHLFMVMTLICLYKGIINKEN